MPPKVILTHQITGEEQKDGQMDAWKDVVVHVFNMQIYKYAKKHDMKNA